ncbi:MAG TPA: zinc ribbon domain-containing protein, partial [Syntrophales bacterium]|nr:zinc ribbon domain-containing protein [Syntrophales bacterium]
REQATHKDIPGFEPVPRAAEHAPAPKIAIIDSPVAPGPGLSLGVYCTQCGNRVPDGSKFCNQCGTRVIVPGGVPPAPVPIKPAGKRFISGQPKSKKKVFIAVGIIVIVLIIVLVRVFVFPNLGSGTASAKGASPAGIPVTRAPAPAQTTAFPQTTTSSRVVVVTEPPTIGIAHAPVINGDTGTATGPSTMAIHINQTSK